MVERLLAKEEVAGSNPVFRSIILWGISWRRSQEVKAGVCKTPISGSSPLAASSSLLHSSGLSVCFRAEVAKWQTRRT